MTTTAELPSFQIEHLTTLPLPLPPGHQRVLVRNGKPGTADTIKLMQGLVANKKRQIKMRELIGKILNPRDECLSPTQRPCQPKDYFCYAKTLYEWVRDNILYVYDPHLVEYIESPDDLLKAGIGDCDSQDILLAAMYQSCGLETQWVTIAADPQRPDEYSHVYIRVLVPKIGWVVADPTMPKKWFGWEAEWNLFKKYWHGSADEEGQELDTRDSVKVETPEMLMAMNAPQTATRPLSGIAGGGGGHGGHGGHHHGGGGSGWWGGGWGGPWYGGWGWDAPVILETPVLVPYPTPTTDQVAVIPLEDALALQSQEPGLQGLGTADAATQQSIYSILSGQTLRDIKAMRAGIDDTIKQLDNTLAAIDKMAPGSQKDAAKAAYDQANASLTQQFATYAKIKDSYNSFITSAKSYAGTIPGLEKALPGLAMPLAPIVLAIAGVAVLVALVYALTDAMAVYTKQDRNTKGYLQQAADLVQATGVTIEQGASSFSKVAIVVGVGLLAYLAYTNREDLKSLFKAKGAR